MTQALAVVAHFDDAIIWMGGAILRTRLDWDWTIVCTCAEERSRRDCFLESCDALGAKGVALQFIDHPDGEAFSQNPRESMREEMLSKVGKGRIDWVFTHNLDAEGEYGPHPNHAEAAQAAFELIGKGVIKADAVQFAYRKMAAAAGSPVVARTDASHVLQLTYEDLVSKAEWCARARDVELRDSALGGVSWLERLAWPCPNPEAFLARGVDLPPPFAKL